MGCDIHVCIQGRYDGRSYWYDLALDFYVERHYPLFAAMADVRNHEEYKINPVAQPRGVPTDLDPADEDNPYTTSAFISHWTGDGHSHSWLMTDEFEEALNRASWSKIWTAGNSRSGIAILAFMRQWEQQTGGAARVVFFFDN